MDTTKTTDTPLSGLKTRRSDDPGHTGMQVTWIDWDSPFRDTALQVGDLVTGALGRRIGFEVAPGGLHERRLWKEAGLAPGDPVPLEVRRRGETLTVSAPLGAERFYSTAEGRRALGPGGPDRMATDGFPDGSWSRWYEERVKAWSHALNGGWHYNLFDTRRLLAEHRDHKARVDFVAQNHPGPFADALLQDWQAVADNLQGTLWPAESIDLSFRKHQEKLAERIADAARQAEEAFRQGLGDRLADAFPAPHPLDDDPATYAGRIVALDGLTQRSLKSDAGHPWFLAGDERRGFYLLDGRSTACLALFDALLDYSNRVSNRYPERYRLYVRLLDEPRRTRLDGRVLTAVKVELLAAAVGDVFFLDLAGDAGNRTFAGAELLTRGHLAAPPDDAPPEEVLRLFFEAEKYGRQDLWVPLFADFRLSREPSGAVVVEPTRGASERDVYFTWDAARRDLFGDVLDVKIVHVVPVEVVLRHHQTGEPQFRECRIEVEHVGLFDGEYRSFKRSRLHREWVLQSMDDGPWRLRDVRGL
jgi:hypothetical protein